MSFEPLPASAWLAGTLADLQRKSEFAQELVRALRESDSAWKELDQWKRHAHPDRSALEEREEKYQDMRRNHLAKVLDRALLPTGLQLSSDGFRVRLAIAPIAPLDGMFTSRSTTITVDKKLLPPRSLHPFEIERLAEVLYHELRHAEQHFRVACWLVANGRWSSLNVLELARNHVEYSATWGPRLPLGTALAEEAAAWFARWTSPYREQHDRHQRATGLLREAQMLLAALRTSGAPRAELRKAQQLVAERSAAYEASLPGYRALPTEVDSRKVAMGLGPLIAAALTQPLAPPR